MGASGVGQAQGILNTSASNNAQTNAAIQAINAQYGTPQQVATNQNYVNAIQQGLTQQLNNQQQLASKNLNFALARSGLQGGSQAAGENAQLQKSYVNGLLQASQAAQSAGSNLVASQNAQKNSLIAQASGANLTGAYATPSAQAINAQLQNAGNNAGAAAVGNVFGQAAQFYNAEQQQAANRQAAALWGNNPYAGTIGGYQ